MRIIFAGTPDFAASALSALLASEHEVVAVYTQPDRPAGRGCKLKASPVKLLAQQASIAVYQPVSLKDETVITQLKAHNADIMVVVAYGLILPTAVLEIPRLGCVNIHASLLPRWRGAAPIQRAILAGDTASGITIIQMDKGLDTGLMLHRLACEITADETGLSLHDKLAELGAQAILEALTKISNGAVIAEAQEDSQACYAHKLLKEEAWIDWRTPAIEVDRKIRAFNAWPVARSMWNEQLVMIWQATVLNDKPSPNVVPGSIVSVSDQGVDVASAQGVIRLEKLQFAGGKPLFVSDILKSKALSVGDVLTSPLL